ncbi:MAG: carboxypeptidase-like regulatory domain-containing protein [Polyangiaceae bacterium]
MLLARPASTAVVQDSEAVATPAAAPKHAVTGTVLDADGNPVEGCSVRIRSDGRTAADWVTSSAGDGSFHVEGLPLGPVTVSAHDSDGASVESAALDVEEAHHAVLVLDRTWELSGTILDARGAPIGRATLKLVEGSGASRIVVADDDGHYAVRAKARSIDRATVWARGFDPTTLEFGGATLDTKRDVRLRAARPIKGTVVDLAGDPVAGARVSACPGKEAEVVLSDRAGQFQLPATVSGCWLTADHPHFASARGMQLRAGRDVVVRLGAGGGIEADTIDERGRPIGAFATTIVSFEPEEGSPAQPTLEGETTEHLRGEFRLDGLAPGNYVLRFNAEGREELVSPTIEIRRGKVNRGHRFVMSPSVVGEITEVSAVSPGASAEGEGTTAEAAPAVTTVERSEEQATE